MKTVYDKDFLLLNAFGKKLYHEAAALLPVIDPHNHIDPAALATNKKFDNIYQLWVQQDPYKHRAMRIFGIAEDFITGSKPDYDKFLAWAECLPHTAGNPLFHWSCMELNELFGITDILTLQNAKQVWDTANGILSEDQFGAMDMVKRFGVELLCTSDDLMDSLEHHHAMAGQQQAVSCLPSLRGDSILAFSQPGFFQWLDKLQTVTSIEISDLDTYRDAIIQRLDFFDAAGCLLSDHSLDSGFEFKITTKAEAGIIFKGVLNSENISHEDAIGLQSHLLHFLGKAYAERNWKMQLHTGAYRSTSTVLRNKLGPAGGYACIGNAANIQSLCTLMDELDKINALPKTILYTLNPADNEAFASITGSYAEDGVKGKIQFGPAWWYNDHAEGITRQLLALSNYGLLSLSIGMTTDSRSIVSFLRHEYYRRILCNLLGSWVEEGKLPADWDYVSGIVKNISYYNIKNWIKK